MKGSLYVRGILFVHENKSVPYQPWVTVPVTVYQIPSFERLLYVIQFGNWRRGSGPSQLGFCVRDCDDIILWTKADGWAPGINPKAPLNAELARFYMQRPQGGIVRDQQALLRIWYEK